MALVARDELDRAGAGGELWQSREGNLSQKPLHTPRKDGEIAKILKGKALPAVGQWAAGRRSEAGELLPEPVRGDGCWEANQHARACSPSAVVVPERPV